MASQHGCVVPGAPFAVDKWSATPGVRHFFLTHMHSDHTQGLTPTWALGTIYCTETSKRLLLDKFALVDSSIIVEVEAGESHVILLGGTETMTVTVLDANHCPGAVMYLFEGYFGSVLCTGDFRYEPAMLDALAGKNIDHIFVDNTYCHPSHSFPAREEAGRLMAEIVRQHPEHEIIIGSDSLGKEDLLSGLARELGLLVCVSATRYRCIQLAGLPDDVFTVNPEETRVQVLMKYQVNLEFIKHLNEAAPTIAILPTGLFHGSLYKDEMRRNPGPGTDQHDSLIKVVPYSDHSSYRELREFLTNVKATTVSAVVGAQEPAFQRHFGDLCRFGHPAMPSIPPAVQAVMFPDQAVKDTDVTRRVENVLKRKAGLRASGSRPATGVVFNSSPSPTPTPSPRPPRQRRRLSATPASNNSDDAPPQRAASARPLGTRNTIFDLACLFKRFDGSIRPYKPRAR